MPAVTCRTPSLAALLAVVAACASTGCEDPVDDFPDARPADGPTSRADAGTRADAKLRSDARQTGTDGGSGDPDGGPPEALPTLVVIPDTQFYACYYHDILRAQTGWIRGQQPRENIRMAIHTGDIVDSDEPEQWQVAAGAMHHLDGFVPYLIAPGNHDLWPDRHTMMNAPAYFPLSGFQREPWFGGSFEANRSDNMFALVDLDDRTWVVIGLEWSPRNRVVEWADAVLSQHADKPAIVFTHAYLYADGTRYDRSKGLQPFTPVGYGFTPEQGINDGEDLWRKIIAPHSNVKLVFSGHVIPDVPARLTSTRPDGTQVHQILANFQQCASCPCEEVRGGNGYLRLVRFDRANHKIVVQTYSPYLDAFKPDAANAFELPMDD